MNNKELLIAKLDREIEDFRNSYKAMEQIKVYNDWYIIGFYEEYYGLLTCDFLEEDDYSEIFKWLSTFENPLAFLYDEWLGADGAFNHDWDEMWDFVETVYREENSR